MGKVRISIYFIGVWLLYSSNLLLAQNPPLGLEGQEFRIWIRNEFYVPNHRILYYSVARDSILAYIDNRNDTIFCVYGGYPYYWPVGYVGDALTNQNDGNILDIEHTVPQSFYNEREPMVSDLHHLFPALQQWNSTRGNFPFAEIADPKTSKWMRLDHERTDIPFSYIDEYSELYDRSFEPREDHKGNCARAIFYFFTVYSQTIYNGLEVDIHALGDINTLFQWHIDDPIDSAEIWRNDHIERLQGNRNPFIDHPEWVVDAWSINKTLLPPPANFQLLERPNSIELSWDDLEHEIRYYLYRSTNQADFIRLASIPQDSTQYHDEDVELGSIYSYYLVGFNGGGNSIPTDTLSGKLADRNTFIDIFFSEYVEGSALNKALEIANYTGATVDLSNYSMRTQKNGSGIWEGNFQLNGSLENEAVWVVANSQAEQSLLTKADTTLISDIVSFNGNDAIGLFKQNELIDIIGYELGTGNFGKNITLVRDPSIYSPNIIFIQDEWLEFPLNTFDNIGSHVAQTNISPPTIEGNFKVFPNPFTDRLIVEYDLYASPYTKPILSLYNVAGKKIELLQSRYTQTREVLKYIFDTSNLPQGIYIMKLNLGQATHSKILYKN